MDRSWIVGETLAVLVLLGASLAAIPWTIAPVTYAAVMILGSWLFPLITSFIPHDAKAPHHNWPELGRRLDPYFARAGVQPLRLFF